MTPLPLTHMNAMATSLMAKADYAAYVLLGVYLPKKGIVGAFGYESLPRPVLTLVGDRDGRARLSYLAREYFASTKAAAGGVNRSPVILLEGVNHSQMALGETLDKDFASERTLEEAHGAIAEYVAAFLGVNLHETSLEGGEKYRSLLAAGMAATEGLVKGYGAAMARDRDVCAAAQMQSAGLTREELASYSIIDLKVTSRGDLASNKPNISLEGQKLQIVSYGIPSKNRNDLPHIPHSNRMIACKMKSAAAITKETGVLGSLQKKSCRQINNETVAFSFNQLTPLQKKRLLATGRRIIIEDAVPHSTGLTWMYSSLPVRFDKGKNLLVTPQILQTSVDTIPYFTGMNYCQIIPAARVMEWMLVEAFY